MAWNGQVGGLALKFNMRRSRRGSEADGMGECKSPTPAPKMRLGETLALTPALSPRRGGSTHNLRDFSRPLVWQCFIGNLTSAATGCQCFKRSAKYPG